MRPEFRHYCITATKYETKAGVKYLVDRTSRCGVVKVCKETLGMILRQNPDLLHYSKYSVHLSYL